jgi:hypothetical protein
VPHPSHDLFYTNKDPDKKYKIVFLVAAVVFAIWLYNVLM